VLSWIPQPWEANHATGRCHIARPSGGLPSGRRPRLTVLLHIHGITSSSATWDPVIPVLAQHAHVIAPDLLGHGDSDKPRADYSLSAFASDSGIVEGHPHHRGILG